MAEAAPPLLAPLVQPAVTARPPPPRPRRIAVPPPALFDRVRVAGALDAVLQADLDPVSRRQAAATVLRRALEEGRALARQALDANGGGLACARHIAYVEDELIRAIHAYVVAQLDPAAGPPPPLVIVAVGGYGRGTLAPGSDIDLLFVLPAGDPARAEHVVEQMLYVLWDLRQKIGHATRSIEECLTQARADMTVRTSLLEARFIDGKEALFEDMRSLFEREIVHGAPAEFVAAKLAERDARIAHAGRSRYLVEPNVKDGKGGLRDLNTLFWIAKYVYRMRRASDLVEAGLFTRAEYRLFCRCEEFLWRVRCQMHFATGRAEERLSFDLQRVIAERLGYVARAGLAAVERFMKHYFLVAKDVGDLTAILCAALEDRQAKPRALLDRSPGAAPGAATLRLTPDFQLETNRLTVSDPFVFQRDPVNLVRLFLLADRNGLPIHPDATRLVMRSLARIDKALRADAEANRLFLDILTSHASPEIVLRAMNQAGVLGRFIPEFGRIVALMQYNMYHHYTVDEHLLQAIGNLADIEKGTSREDYPLVREAMASVTHRRALYVAVFLHDIAKGREEDHTLAGMNVARRLCPRLGLSAEETEIVVGLIRLHLVMSDTAQRRDLGDRNTIETFAAQVQTVQRLKMLLVLTVCDIRAVGPGVWNAWKGELLRTLYWETHHVLTGAHSAADRDRRAEIAREELRKALPHWTAHDFEAYAGRHQQPYWIRVDLATKLRHANLLNMSEVEMPAPMTDVTVDEGRGVTVLTVMAPDHPRVLSIIAGACAASAANIVDAQVFTTVDGVALDTICISRAFDFDEDEIRRGARIALAVERALLGQIRIQDFVAGRAAAMRDSKPFDVPPEVSINNLLSNRFSVLEFSGLDRPGLLFDLTRVISMLELNIHSAHIATFGEKAVDAFYVTDFDGEKITALRRQEAIRRRLFQLFGGAKEAASGAQALGA